METLQMDRRSLPGARQEPRDDLLLQHAPELARHARREEEPRLADVERKPAGGADRVVEDFRRGRQHRLLVVVGRHDAVAAAEEILHALQPVLVEDELDAGGAGGDFLREVVDGGPQPAIDYDGIGALGRQPEGREQLLAVVADGRPRGDREPEILELLGHVAEIGIDDLAGQDLVAGADDLDAHLFLLPQ
jgi:hypothetical protein